jgi:hypothetical protein
MKKAYDVAAGVLTFTAADGSVQTLEVSKLSEEIRLQAMFHGLSQKIGDSYAGAGSESDPESFAKECVRDTIEQLYNGAWRAAGGGGGSRVSILVQAFAAVSGQSLEDAAAYIENLSDEEKKDLQKKAKVRVAIQKIKLERETAKLAKAEADAAAEANG